MINQKNKLECAKINCKCENLYFEKATNGEVLICISGRHHGKPHVRKYTREEFEAKIKAAN